MKKRSKQIFGFLGIILGLGILTSCNSFCSVKDNAAYRYANDPVNTLFFETEVDAANFLLNSLEKADQTVYFSTTDQEVNLENIKSYTVSVFNDEGSLVQDKLIQKADFFETENLNKLVSGQSTEIDVGDIYFIRTATIETYTLNDKEEKTEYKIKVSKNDLVQSLESSVNTAGINLPANQYWTDLDKKSVSYMASRASEDEFYKDKSYSSAYELFYGYTAKAYSDYQNEKNDEKLNILLNGGEYTYSDNTKESILGRNNSLFTMYGRYKFLEKNTENDLNMGSGEYWSNIETWNYEIKTERNLSGYVMNSDFFGYYQNTLNSKVAALKSCFTIDDNFYGHTSNDELNDTIILTNKSSWGDAWSHGWLEGLLVYPIAYMVEYFSHAFGMAGWGQIASVLLVTIIVRAFFMLVTFSSTLSQQRMQMLQPEIAKLQQKYPNSDTNQYEKQRLAQAQMALYKKYKVHPFSSIIVMIIQFPLFISVWNGMSGAASLSVDAVLGLRLSDTIASVLFNFSGWPSNPGWWTALLLILFMSAGQIVSMKLPQWLQASRMKKVSKSVISQAETSAQKQMKIVSWIMTIFIIIMGFTLPAAMGVYWFAGALFSIIQTTIMHFVMNNKKHKEKK